MNPNNENTYLIVATTDYNSPREMVLRESLKQYSQLRQCIIQTAHPFGKIYSDMHDDALALGFDYVIHCNDDVVLRPDTIEKLFHDAAYLNDAGIKWGWLAARTDWVRHSAQNIRFPYDNKSLDAIGYPEESLIVEVSSVSPIFAITKAADFLPYAPINWFSDDEQCYRMRQAGYRHFVSRAYVHHVGSQTMTPETWQAEQAASIDFLREYNPQFLLEHSIA
jgi:GT2 family glycosyltransferase